jgi:hypothetical protein
MKIHTLVTIGLFSLVACSSSSGGGTSGAGGNGGNATTGSTTSTTSTGTSTHMNQCVMPGDKGNANGVGAYCTPGGGECANFPLAGLCLADVGQDEWFCTRIGCMMDSDCGMDATCYKDTGGSACVPNKCLSSPDAGADGSADGG